MQVQQFFVQARITFFCDRVNVLIHHGHVATDFVTSAWINVRHSRHVPYFEEQAFLHKLGAICDLPRLRSIDTDRVHQLRLFRHNLLQVQGLMMDSQRSPRLVGLLHQIAID